MKFARMLCKNFHRHDDDDDDQTVGRMSATQDSTYNTTKDISK